MICEIFTFLLLIKCAALIAGTRGMRRGVSLYPLSLGLRDANILQPASCPYGGDYIIFSLLIDTSTHFHVDLLMCWWASINGISVRSQNFSILNNLEKN